MWVELILIMRICFQFFEGLVINYELLILARDADACGSRKK